MQVADLLLTLAQTERLLRAPAEVLQQQELGSIGRITDGNDEVCNQAVFFVECLRMRAHAGTRWWCRTSMQPHYLGCRRVTCAVRMVSTATKP